MGGWVHAQVEGGEGFTSKGKTKIDTETDAGPRTPSAKDIRHHEKLNRQCLLNHTTLKKK